MNKTTLSRAFTKSNYNPSDEELAFNYLIGRSYSLASSGFKGCQFTFNKAYAPWLDVNLEYDYQKVLELLKSKGFKNWTVVKEDKEYLTIEIQWKSGERELIFEEPILVIKEHYV